jgi:UbiD family decarboxylase
MYVTSSIVIARTPDVEGFNASVHRLMFIDRERVAIRIVPRHLYRIVSLNSRVGKDTPVAIVVGVHPALMLLASSSPPYGIFELGLAKELLGSSIRFCRTPKYDLPVPCDSALVMEGRITNEYVSEGPFLDLLNLYDRVRQQPIIHVESIYLNVSRDEQLFHVILPGGMEHKLLMGFPREASIWDVVRKVVPKVVKVRLTPAGGCWLHAVISIEKNSDGDAKNAILAAFAAHPSLKHVVVVDPDIDPDNPVDVEWAIATRFQAGEDLILIRGVRGSTLDPSSDDGITDKLGIDATAPLNKLELFRRVRT